MYEVKKQWDNQKLAALMRPDYIAAPGHAETVEEFLTIGEHFIELLEENAGLKEDSNLLDIGSCVARMAIPATEVITKGQYRGFDPIKDYIEWCKAQFAAFPNFQFDYADIYNASYNPSGTIQSKDFRFPYLDDFFNCALATSVFTHMSVAEDVQHYFDETERVLDHGGIALFTFFFGDRKAHPVGNDHIMFYDEAHVRDMAKKAGLEVMRVDYGAWTDLPADNFGGPSGIDYQDAIYLKKP